MLNFQGYEHITRIDPAYHHRWGIEGLRERFLRRVEKTACCWLWRGSVAAGGYGITHLNGRSISAHRASFILFVGEIDPGKDIDHVCRNRVCGCAEAILCVRWDPDHLEQKTRRENILASPTHPMAVNARKTHCMRGHPLSGANLYIQSEDGWPTRHCKACQRELARRTGTHA